MIWILHCSADLHKRTVLAAQKGTTCEVLVAAGRIRICKSHDGHPGPISYLLIEQWYPYLVRITRKTMLGLERGILVVCYGL